MCKAKKSFGLCAALCFFAFCPGQAEAIEGGVDSPEVGEPWLYPGLAFVGFAWAFVDAYGIGANDVANSFSSIIASKTISHQTAVVIALFAEFGGAMVLGASVTDTVRKSIMDVTLFQHDPYVLMLAMCCVSFGSGVWVVAATALSLPVSTTHSTVGALMGIGIAAFGVQGVVWDYNRGLFPPSPSLYPGSSSLTLMFLLQGVVWDYNRGLFPPSPSLYPGFITLTLMFLLQGVVWDYNRGGFLKIMASWFISPVFAGILAGAFYLSMDRLILRLPEKAAFDKGLAYLPALFFITFTIVSGFMLLKGSPALGLDKLPLSVTLPMILAIGAVFAVFAHFCAVPWCRRVIGGGENIPWTKMLVIHTVPPSTQAWEKELKMSSLHSDGDDEGSTGKEERTETADGKKEQEVVESIEGGWGAVDIAEDNDNEDKNKEDKGSEILIRGQEGGAVGGQSSFASFSSFSNLKTKVFVDISEETTSEELMGDVKHNHAKVEELYKMLQVTASALQSVAHGSNDIANSIGPLAALWMVYSTGRVSEKAPLPAWIILYGAVALDIGLITYGHKIMRVLGHKMTYHSPARSFCISMGAMFTVLFFSKIGVPVSTTHCICGATAAVGWCGGKASSVNWKMILTISLGWVVTCPAAGLMAGLTFYAVATSPRPMQGNGFFEL